MPALVKLTYSRSAGAIGCEPLPQLTILYRVTFLPPVGPSLWLRPHEKSFGGTGTNSTRMASCSWFVALTCRYALVSSEYVSHLPAYGADFHMFCSV